MPIDADEVYEMALTTRGEYLRIGGDSRIRDNQRLDMFAAFAMQGFVSRGLFPLNGDYKKLAFDSFEIARAMIKESSISH